MSQIDPLPPPMPRQQDRWQGRAGTFWGGGILILIGVYFLLANLGLLNWLNWNIAWPVILIALGVYLVVRRLR
jgi:phage shock protein C